MSPPQHAQGHFTPRPRRQQPVRRWRQPSVLLEESAFPTRSSSPSTRDIQKRPTTEGLSTSHGVRCIAGDLIQRTVQFTLDDKSEGEHAGDTIPSKRERSPWRLPRSPEIFQGEPYLSSPSDEMTSFSGSNNDNIVASILHAPTAWGSNFWVVLADPVTDHSFYACPATGDCSWDPPLNAMVLPRNAAGDWWELRDDKRGGRSYYYQTVTKKTQWTRPSNVLVIPLAQVQTQLQVLRDAPRSIPETSNINIVSRTQYQDTTGWKKREQGPAVVADDVAPVNVNLARESNDTSLLGQPIGDVGPTSSHTSLAAFHPARTQAEDNIQIQATRESEKLFTSFRFPMWTSPGIATGKPLQPSPQQRPTREVISPASSNTPVMHKVSEAHRGDQDVEHRRIIAGAKSEEPPSLTHRLNAITSQEEPHIPFFRTSSVTSVAGRVVLSEVADKPRYSDEFFAVHRKGLTRKRLTQHELMKWQSRPFPGPLLAKTTPSSVIDCPKVFKVIQHIMGDRDLPVEGIVPPKPSEAATRLLTRQKSEATEERDQVWEKVEKTMLLDEMRWLLHLGIRYSDLRDEVYAMTIKQVNDNPLRDSVFRAFQLFSVLVATFPPSDIFEPYIRTFLETHGCDEDFEIQIMASYCCRQLPKTARRGAQLRAPMYSEIENAGEAAFNHIIFGESLQIIMQDQAEQYPHLRVPVPLVHSAEAIIQLGGLNTRGIFLSMGDPDVVSEVKARFERYQDKLVLDDITDPHVMASVLKRWLKELEEPLIPDDLYWDCLRAASDSHMSCMMIRRLPLLNRRSFFYLIGFLQLFLAKDIVPQTKMTAEWLAVIFAPNILRRPSDARDTALTVTHDQESNFIMNILQDLDISQLEPQIAADLPKVSAFRDDDIVDFCPGS